MLVPLGPHALQAISSLSSANSPRAAETRVADFGLHEGKDCSYWILFARRAFYWSRICIFSWTLRPHASRLQTSGRQARCSRSRSLQACQVGRDQANLGKKITQPQWLGDFRTRGSLLSDLWMTLDVAGLHERITVGETVESNVVVFDLRIKRGDF